ncbi:MAG: hypothetical protein QNL04_05845 [SAR324 cluster bacterium]|nr:hypothetical protein [SAR324 cluster bacterium]
MILKLAIILLGTYFLYRLAKYTIKKKLEKMLGIRFKGNEKKREVKADPSLVQCATCGTFVSEEQAIHAPNKKVFCSPDCKKNL